MALTPEQQQLLNDLLEKNIQLEEKLAEYREKNIKDYENILSEEEKVVIEKSKKLELITQELDKIEFLSKEKLKQRGYTAETVKLLKQQAKELRGVEKQSEKIKQYTSSVADSAEDILGKYFGINSQTKKLGENLQKPLKYTGDIAKKVNSHPRAVGGAVGKNPIPIIIPCHRVVGSNGALTGFSGGNGLPTKEILIQHEQQNINKEK